jgi:hypothetical protein
MSFFKKLFGLHKKTDQTPAEQPDDRFSQDEYEKYYELKEWGLENVLGKMYEMVGHAIIPFSMGGAVDMNYFPNHIPGTGFATMELLDPDGNGPKPNSNGTYELVAFTKYPYETSDEKETPFDLIERRVCGTFTTIGNYSFQAVLKPCDTCEVPRDGEENRCVVFDLYEPDNKVFKIGDRKHHLLLCMEIFRSEMDFARENGSTKLFELLKQKNYYPYSDLDREPVV